MSDLNKKNINYGALNRFYQDLKNHDLSDLNDKIDNIDVPEYVAGNQIVIDSSNSINVAQSLLDTIASLQEQLDALNWDYYLNQYLTFESTSGTSIIGWYTDSRNTAQPTFEYSFNKTTWTQLPQANKNDATTYISISEGSKLYLRGTNLSGVSQTADIDYSGFVTLNQPNDGTTLKVYGNIMSLIDYQHMESITTMVGDFYYIFGCVDEGDKLSNTNDILHITDAKNLILPAITLTRNSYNGMFDNMWFGNGENNYLIYAPTILPATTLAEYCYYNMFKGCTSLTTAPELPATTLRDACYQGMFLGCSSLTTAPELPAVTLANNCYDSMFLGCTNMNYIKCLATDISAASCTEDWLKGVSSTGTFVTPSSTNWSTGVSGIPSGWTIVDYVESNAE